MNLSSPGPWIITTTPGFVPPPAGISRYTRIGWPLTWMVSLRAMMSLLLRLHGAGGQAGDVVVHEEGIDDGDRHRAEQRAGHELAPVEDVAADQLGDDADRHRAHVALGQEDQRVEELVLRQREREDPGGQQARRAQRQHG